MEPDAQTRAATDADVPVLVTLARRQLSREPHSSPAGDTLELEARLRFLLNEPDVLVGVAEAGGAVQGAILMQPRGSRLDIRLFATLPNCPLCIAPALVRWGVETAQQAGVSEFIMTADAGNHRRAWKRMGFEPIAVVSVAKVESVQEWVDTVRP